MLELVTGGTLATFRTMHRPDLAQTQWFEARRIADHRRAYLAYEGPVSGDRGDVRRVAGGGWLGGFEPADRFACRIDAGGLEHVWTATSWDAGVGTWVFERDDERAMMLDD